MNAADQSRRACEILAANTRQSAAGAYTVPNGQVYPFQWNWDSAFVAIGFAAFNVDRGWRELETLFAAQWADGFVPHIVFWQDDDGYFPGPDVWASGTDPRSSGITQPPVAATAARKVWEAAPSTEFQGRLEELFPKLMAYHRWFRDIRDPDGRGVVVTVHPWETGRDNSPEWDQPGDPIDVSKVGEYVRRDTGHLDAKMRPTKLEYDRYLALVQFGRGTGWDHARIARESPFRVADVGMSMILLRANRDLLWLAELLGKDSEAEELRAMIARSEAGIDYLWNAEKQCWASRDVITGRSSGFVTSASFLSFYAGLHDTAKDAAMLAHFDRIAAQVRYMVPSLDPEEPGFQMIRYWRGPVWAVVNYMIGLGLLEQGHAQQGERVVRDTRAMMDQTGFFEAYSPIDGAGSGGDDFSWTAAIWLAWAGKELGGA